MEGRLCLDMSVTVTARRTSVIEVLADRWPDFLLWWGMVDMTRTTEDMSENISTRRLWRGKW